jgi:putative (di)nucleoside polyphosphate hydrolase
MAKEKSTAPTKSGDSDPLPYRRGVGIALFNRDGKVFIAQRIDNPGPAWQMPQGGIDKGETPREAAVRELAEETSVTSADIVAEIPHWLTYDLPDELLGVALKGKYRGQRQRWFAMRFWGDDSEIDINPRNGKAEFDRWSWRDMAELPELIVSFKRPIYQTVVERFAYLVQN